MKHGYPLPFHCSLTWASLFPYGSQTSPLSLTQPGFSSTPCAYMLPLPTIFLALSPNKMNACVRAQSYLFVTP